MRGADRFNCSRRSMTLANRGGDRRGPSKAERRASLASGAYDLSTDTSRSSSYYIDLRLVGSLARFFRERNAESVMEFGAGHGCYSDALRLRGISTRAYEGANNIEALTQGLVRHADLTKPLQLGASADWVLCLEVTCASREHRPCGTCIALCIAVPCVPHSILTVLKQCTAAYERAVRYR